MLGGMHTSQIAIRMPDDLLAELDTAIPRRFASRAEAVRIALTQLLRSETIEQLEERHRRGWQLHPATDRESEQARAESRALIAEEPW